MRELVRVVLAVLLFGGAAAASQPPEAVVVGFVPDQADQQVGRAVMAEAYRRLGVEATFRSFDAAGALEASRSGEVDAELNRIGGIDQSFPELIQIPIPVNIIRGVVFSRRYRFPVRSWRSLKPYRIGIVRGSLFAEQGTVGMDVRAAASSDELVRWIADDEVEVGVLPRIVGQAALREAGIDDVHELDGVLETLLIYHYVNVRRADLATRLEPVLKEMLLDGTTRRLLGEAQERVLGSAP
ncbi:MAG: transporter substrate-binding domain-containing protein [Myxococcota bacterium]|nr:transporter substrate-binding domain-containing protein [Myxococcota bacterium]